MKRISSLLLAAAATLALCSCSNPADTARVSALTSLAVNYAESRGILSPADAKAIRDAGSIILAPVPAAAPPLGAKAPVANLQP